MTAPKNLRDQCRNIVNDEPCLLGMVHSLTLGVATQHHLIPGVVPQASTFYDTHLTTWASTFIPDLLLILTPLDLAIRFLFKRSVYQVVCPKLFVC